MLVRPHALSALLATGLGLARDGRIIYVVVNLAVNLLVLVRSYVFLLALDYRDLGLITLLQSVIMLLGVMQFGVINGAYRLILSAPDGEKQELVDFVFSFIALLTVLALGIACATFFMLARMEDWLIGVVGVIGGGATLVRNWQSNQMIAEQRLKTLNIINLGSALAALGFFVLLPISPLLACMAVVVAPPVLFAVIAALAKCGGIPHRFALPGRLAKHIFATGFAIFLAGMMVQLNIQIERWYVLAELGLEALGHLFIAVMMLNLIQMVPNALDAVFLPSAVRAHHERDFGRLARTMRFYLLVLVAYAAACAIVVALLAEPVLTLLAPRYIPDLGYAYLIMPGALALVVSAAFALVFTVLIRYRYLLIAYASGTAALAIVLGAALLGEYALSLDQVMAVRSGGLGLTALLAVCGWWLVSGGHPGLRFTAPRGDSGAASDPTVR